MQAHAVQQGKNRVRKNKKLKSKKELPKLRHICKDTWNCYRQFLNWI